MKKRIGVESSRCSQTSVVTRLGNEAVVPLAMTTDMYRTYLFGMYSTVGRYMCMFCFMYFMQMLLRLSFALLCP